MNNDALGRLQAAIPEDNHSTAFLEGHHEDLAAVVREKGYSLAAELLGLPKSTLHSFLLRHNIPRGPDRRSNHPRVAAVPPLGDKIPPEAPSATKVTPAAAPGVRTDRYWKGYARGLERALELVFGNPRKEE